MSEVRAYIRHARQVPTAENPYCTSGWREFFKRKGWSWSDFIAEGIPVSVLEACGDEPAQQLAARARGG